MRTGLTLWRIGTILQSVKAPHSERLIELSAKPYEHTQAGRPRCSEGPRWGAAAVMFRRENWYPSASCMQQGVALLVTGYASVLLGGCTSTAAPPMPTPNLKPFVRIDGKPADERQLMAAKTTCRSEATSNPAYVRRRTSPAATPEPTGQATASPELDEMKVSAIAAEYDACMAQNGYIRG